MDKYQERYNAHQLRKKETLLKLMKLRHSTRIFADREVEAGTMKGIIESLVLCPSSCDRRGVYTKVVTERDEKALLGGLLVGGVGWVHRAPVIILLFADPTAYKEGLVYMPYLDAGVQIYHLYLMAEANGLKACYINPNMRDNQIVFQSKFGFDIFCGAVVLGYE